MCYDGRPQFATHDLTYESPRSTAFADKYAPTSVDEVCGNESAKEELNECIDSDVRTPICVYGPAGVGKHSTVRLLLQRHGVQVVDYCLSVHSVDAVRQLEASPDEDVMMAMLQVRSRRALVFSDAESLAKGERAKLAQLLPHLDDAMCILVTRHPLPKCIGVAFHDLTPCDLAVHVCWVAAEEGIECDGTDIVATDMRSAMNALQFGQMSAVYVTAGDDDLAHALKCRETLRASEGGDALEAACTLLDTLSLADTCPFFERSMLNVAARMSACKLHPAASTTMLARHAQGTARRNIIRHAREQLHVHSLDTSLSVRILRGQQLDALGCDDLCALSTLSAVADRGAIRAVLRSKRPK